MKKIINNSYIIGLSEITGEDISAEEKESILTAFNNRPAPPSGYSYRLKTDLTWELHELPPEPEPSGSDELTDAEALDILLGGAT